MAVTNSKGYTYDIPLFKKRFNAYCTLTPDCLFFFELNFIENVFLDIVFWICFQEVLRCYYVQLYKTPVYTMTTLHLSILLLLGLHTCDGICLSDNATVSQSICIILSSTWQCIKYLW